MEPFFIDVNVGVKINGQEKLQCFFIILELTDEDCTDGITRLAYY